MIFCSLLFFVQNCAPIDTVFTLVWSEGGRGMFAVPMSLDDIEQDMMDDIFPVSAHPHCCSILCSCILVLPSNCDPLHVQDAETLQKWFNKEEAHWPRRPELRFTIGTRVECRIGPNPIRGWAPGVITALFYSEPGWPQSMYAPYQIRLDDGRLIFAPQDIDAVKPSASLTPIQANLMLGFICLLIEGHSS